MTAPTALRVEALEAEAFRTGRELTAINGRLDHVTNAIGDLSGDQREFRHEMRERLGVVEGQLGGIAQEQARQSATLAAIAKHLGIVDPADEPPGL